MKYDFYLDMSVRRSHTVILEKIKPQSVVLELGSSTGVMTNYMKNNLNCKVYICEIDESSINIAKQYAEGSWQGDLDSLQWTDAFGQMKFDYIVCADILEHLRNPEAVLDTSKKLLKDGGSVLLSIPNVAHNSVVFNLLENRFDYTEVGILDKTHLKFFTYSSTIKLCVEAGYIPVDQDAIYEDCQYPIAQKLPSAVKYREYSHVFQFIFELKKAQYVEDNKIGLINRIQRYPLNNTVRLYVDAGDGYIDTNRLELKINTVNINGLNFDLFRFDNIKEIKFEPSQAGCAVKVNQIFISKKDGGQLQVDIFSLKSNAVYHADNIFVFNNKPEILIQKVPESVLRLYIEIEFIDLNMNLPGIRSIFENMNNMKDGSEQHVSC